MRYIVVFGIKATWQRKIEIVIVLMFVTRGLSDQQDSFVALSNGVQLEKFSETRQGAIVVRSVNGLVPIVRTTTSYNHSSQHFTSAHYDLIDSIKKATGHSKLQFNNAMIEIYEPAYTKMGFHSDQSLDLARDSTICIFSCYENEDEPYPRKLAIKNKENGSISEMVMEHNSCVIFSTLANDNHLHKIVSGFNRCTSRWLGLTLRLSDTFVYSRGEDMFFAEDDVKLRRASESERKEFCRHKSLENAQIGYRYPSITYTLSQH